MNAALWIIQGLLCALFLLIGGLKIFAYERFKTMSRSKSSNQSNGLSKELVTFVGLSESAGAAGLILPLATGVAPILTALAALGLAIIMVLASIYHWGRKESPAFPIVLLVLASFVAYGRGLS